MFARSNLIRSLKTYNTKSFHAGKKVSSSVMKADESIQAVKLYHTSAIALAALFPIAFVASPSIVSMPVDVALSVLVPVHAHVGLNFVVADYVPKSARPLARGLVLALTIVTAAGLLKLSVQGPGVTDSLKSLWRKPQPGAKQCPNCTSSCKSKDCKIGSK